ncbi:MAG: GGDEF domain-containing protein [Acidimicrobiales bacterium]|nr:MAG: GGDEF domain-containing protein [Acidimicrobiales bacterium]
MHWSCSGRVHPVGRGSGVIKFRSPVKDNPATDDGGGPSTHGFADTWAATIWPTGFVSMSLRETQLHLLNTTQRLVAALTDPTQTAQLGRSVGEELVDAHFTNPEALELSLSLIASRLLKDFAPQLRHINNAELRSRLGLLLGAIAAGFSTALRDVTFSEQEQIRRAGLLARETTERDLRGSEARFRAVFAGAAIGIAIADISGNILHFNPAMEQILGDSSEAHLFSSVAQFVDLDDAPELWSQYQRLVNGEQEQVQSEKRYVRPDGSVVWADMVISLVRDDNGHPRYLVVLVEDVSERRRLQTTLHHQALHDPLTGLPNRTLFFDRLRRLCNQHDSTKRIGLCYLDLDRFKAVNDSLGHHVGDKLLVELAERLARCTADAGHIVARMGGDEFVVLVEDCEGTRQLKLLAEQLLEALAAPFEIADHQLTVSASIGLVEHQAAGADPAELLKAADITLYWAKSEGNGGWALHESERRGRQVARYELSAAMPRALAHGEFLVEYQPLVRLRDSVTIGTEALVRWNHPVLGRLGPQHFIDLAEETGQIVPLGRWVFEQSCAQAALWSAEFGAQAPFVSINLAVRQLRDPGIVAELISIAQAYDVAPQQLQLELTESEIMGPSDEALERLRTLADAGFVIAIDDFGTGYSNLAYLRRLPVQALKLASSFVTGLQQDPNGDRVGEEIMKTLIHLSHILGLHVTAEGIETDEQARQLRDLGCDNGQGWLFAKPGPPETITEMLRPKT